MGGRRWMICGLLFFATTVNYMDRQVIALLKPTLQIQFGWTEQGYGDIIFAFTLAYAIGLLFIGKLIDRFGTRKGFSLAVFVWSASAMAHAAASSVLQFGIARFSLGLGEAGSFPAAVKAVAEWFPKRERALATGLFNSGSNIGAIVTPLVVPWITYRFGWRMAFIATGAVGVVWILCWLSLYRRPEEDAKVTAAELAYIQSDPPEQDDQAADSKATVPWLTMLRLPQAWAIAVGKFFTDPIWWVYLFWMPDFLSKLGLSLTGMALPLFVIYSGACVGSIGGGWLSSALLKRGWTSERQPQERHAGVRIGGDSYHVCGAHQECVAGGRSDCDCGGSASGLVGKHLYAGFRHVSPECCGSVVGFGTMAGAIGGMCIAKTVGYILQRTRSVRAGVSRWRARRIWWRSSSYSYWRRGSNRQSV
jgi:MFS transporter, ACS family, hexuronate transporter